MAHPSWQISGEYFESCNCEVLCPCLLSRAQGRPTEGHCDVVVAVHVDSGRFGDTPLDGLNAVLVVYTPGVMAQGDWTVACYVDERASGAQRQGLEAVCSGQAGGPLGRFAPLIARRMPTKAVPISFASQGKSRKVEVPGIMDVTVEGIIGVGDQEVWLDNVGHFASRRLAAARGTSSRYRDHAFTFDNTGRNGHYAPIRWSGP
ncbi:MAG: DUF1326 domain-containing protein [Candidatus Rokubacteria bacterium]|nr:DUF1326 domain-containing protein [Candidatus Rokubacteria bacterium]